MTKSSNHTPWGYYTENETGATVVIRAPYTWGSPYAQQYYQLIYPPDEVTQTEREYIITAETARLHFTIVPDQTVGICSLVVWERPTKQQRELEEQPLAAG